MKVVNKTDLETRDLQKLLSAVADKEHLSDVEKKQVVLEVIYRRRSDNWRDDQMPVSYWGKGRWRFVGKVVKGVKVLDSVQAAKGMGLAMAGAQGCKYDRSSSDYGWGKGWQEKWAWAKEFLVKAKEKKVPQKPTEKDRAVGEMSHCLEQIISWEKKLKLAQTKLKVWNRRLKRLTSKGAKLVEAPMIQVIEPPKGVMDMVGEIKKMENQVLESMAVPKEMMG